MSFFVTCQSPDFSSHQSSVTVSSYAEHVQHVYSDWASQSKCVARAHSHAKHVQHVYSEPVRVNVLHVLSVTTPGWHIAVKSMFRVCTVFHPCQILFLLPEFHPVQLYIIAWREIPVRLNNWHRAAADNILLAFGFCLVTFGSKTDWPP